MFNIFNEKDKRTKPHLTEKSVLDFLNGAYEKDAKFHGYHIRMDNGEKIESKYLKRKELKGIRAIHVNYKSRDVEIIFAKSHRKKFGARIVHRNGLKPFVWSKNGRALLNNGFFDYNIVEVEDDCVDSKVVYLPNGELRNLDGKDVRVLKSLDKNGKTVHWIRYKVLNEDEKRDLFVKKARLYGLEMEKQIKSFDNPTVKRMEEGFSYKFYINENLRGVYSDNPYFQDIRQNKITGSFKNLQDFFREGGVAPRGTLYLDEEKLREFMQFFSQDVVTMGKIYIHLHRWRRQFNPFTKHSCNFDKVIKIYQSIYKGIAFRINKSFINNDIDSDPKKFFKTIDKYIERGVNNDLKTNVKYKELVKIANSKKVSDKAMQEAQEKADAIWNECFKVLEQKLYASLFDVKLDEEKIIDYIVEPYTFDSGRNSKELIDFFENMGTIVWEYKPQQLFSVHPLEQYMIQTGRRLFKGIENYEDLEILTVDIETTALPDCEHIKTAALYPETGRVFQVGLGDNKDYFEILHAKEPHEEQKILEDTYRIIAERDADIVLTYNGEYFDFPFMEKRLGYLGCTAKEYGEKHTTAQYIRELVYPYYHEYGEMTYKKFHTYYRVENSMLKVGGGTEDFTQTRMFGKNICDVMFAVKRAAAIDTSIPNFRLKDNIIHAKLAAKNRVYIQGDQIGALESDTRKYYLNTEDGKYFLGEKSINFFKGDYNKEYIKEGEDGKFYKTKKKLFIYTDDGSGKYNFLKGCTNTFGIKIHHNGETFNDGKLMTARQSLDDQFTGFFQLSLPYEGVEAPLTGIGTELKNVGAVNCYNYLAGKLSTIRKLFKDVKNIYGILADKSVDWKNVKQVSGSYLVHEYLRGDIKEPYLLDRLYSQATFAIAKWLPAKYEKIATMGNANVWKLLLAAWSYLNCIAIPNYEEPQEFTGGLLGMVSAGFHRNIVKIDYSSLYPSEFLQHCETPDIDITGIYKKLVGVSLNLRLEYKQKKNDAKAAGNSADEQLYDKKQLPLKILINSFYGMLGAPKVSPFAHIDSAWHITCSGRQHMRHLIHWFKPRGFKVIYFHTDGANFVIPEGVDDYTYISNGANWKNTAGEQLTGVEAYVAEYNDLFMKGKMAVDIDEYAISCINFSKGNFSYLKEKKGKYIISHVGGTLSKKNQNQYIKDFFEDNLETLFLGDGASFLDAYYAYVKKIYNQDIVAGKIANKNRVTKSLDEYVRGVNEGKYVKQAHMELALLHELQVTKGDWIYTLNNGDGKKETGDLKKVNDVMGEFEFDNPAAANTYIKKLEKHLHDLNFIMEEMLSAEKNNKFAFKKETIEREVANLFEVNIVTERVSKAHRIHDIFEVEEVKFKYVEKTRAVRNAYDKFVKIEIEVVDPETGELTKKTVNKKETVYLVQVIYVTRNLNARIVKAEDLDAKIPYNPIKYIDKFNQSMENIWIVFHPDIRPKIPTPNRKKITGEDYDRKPNQRGWFMDDELELVSGYPLDGKEDKQQDLDELLVVTEEEMDFWKKMNLSPNNSFDEKAVNINENYCIDIDNNIYLQSWVDANTIVKETLTGGELMYWLTDKIILDVDNPPYKFVEA
jgi:DNA polymerase elongation subunit (family B)